MGTEVKSPEASANALRAGYIGKLGSADHIHLSDITQHRRAWLCRRHGIAQRIARVIADAVFGA